MAGKREFSVPHKFGLELIGPIQTAVSKVTSYGHTVWQKYIDLLDVRKENGLLRQELQQYKTANIEFREALATNVRLRNLLELKESLPPPTLTAEIVGKDPSLWFRTVIVDRGSNDGLTKGMPVVNSEGIVGQVFSVSPNYSKVLLAIAPSSAIDVLLQGSRVRGILKGTGSLAYKVDYVLKTVDIQEGDHVVTAGYGGLFPTGMPVGVVSKVVRKRRGMFLDIEVTPTVDFLTLEDLLIIEQEKPFSQ